MFAPPPTSVSYGDYFNTNGIIDAISYTDYLGPYSVPVVGGGDAPAVVRGLATGARASGIPTAFIQAADNGLLNMLLQLDRVEARMGLPPNVWTDRNIIQLGDLHLNQAVLIELPDSAWNMVAAVRVLEYALVEAALDADPALETMGPFAATDAGTEVVRNRRLCAVPPALVEGLLAIKDLTARKAWKYAYPICVAKGWLVSCAPLLDYFRCSLTVSVDGENPVIWERVPVVPVLLDGYMIGRRNKLIADDFPALDARAAVLQQNSVASAIAGLRSDMHNQRLVEEERLERASKHPLASVYGEANLLFLLRLFNVSSEEELPQDCVWVKLANSKKAMHLSILQAALDVEKLRQQERGLQFLATPSLLQTIFTLNLSMTNSNAVTTGLQPFRLHDHPDAEQIAGLQFVYEIVRGEGASLSVADAQGLARPTAAAPVLLLHARQQMKRMDIIVSALLTPSHPLVQALAGYHVRFSAMEHKLQELMPAEPLLPSLLIKRVAMHLTQWFDTQKFSSQRVPVPNFMNTLDAIENEDPWKPTVPASFLAALGLQSIAAAAATPAATPPLVPRVPRTPNLAPAPRVPTVASAAFNNTQFNPRFQPFKDSVATCRDVRANIGTNPGQVRALPLSRVDQKPMCLAFHTKGVCNPNCGRIADHVAYTNAQYDSLFEWCQECFPM